MTEHRRVYGEWMRTSLRGCFVVLLLTATDGASASTDPSLETVKSLTMQLLHREAPHEGGSAALATGEAMSDQLNDVALQRKQTLLALMETDPAAVLAIALPDHLRRTIPARVRSHVEHAATLEGTLQVLVETDAAFQTAKVSYELAMSGGRHATLHFAGRGPSLVSGSRIRVRGVRLEDHLALGSADGGSVETLEAASLEPLAVKKVAVVLFNLQTNPVQPYTPAHAKAVTFTNADGANAYYQEASFGQMALEGYVSALGDVFGWVTIGCDEDPLTTAPSCSTCDYNGWATAARAAAGVNANNYHMVIHAFPSHSACGWWGLGRVGGSPSYAWVNGSYQTRVVGHELAHNLGLYHANSLNCTNASGQRVPISQTCTEQSYGDPYSILGGSGSTHHFHNYHKGRLNWLGTGNTQDVTVGGLYSIAPIEYATNGVQSLRIPRDIDANGNVTKYYYLEFRQPYGLYFDAFSATSPAVNGVSIRLAPPYGISDESLLIDTVSSTTSFTDAPLAVNKTFTDPFKNITVTTRSISSSGAAVEIQLGPTTCVRANPALTLTPPERPWAAAGQSLTYTVRLTNQDGASCAASTFVIQPTAPTGWSQAPASLTETLAAGASITRTVTVTSATSATPGFYTVTETATDIANATRTASASAPFNVFIPDTTAPLITGMTSTGVTASSATITWITDEPADSQVEYGLSTSNLQTTSLAPALVTSHRVTLSGLIANTAYVYRVKSKDVSGNLTISPFGNFTTSSGASVSITSVQLDSTTFVINGESVTHHTTMRNAGTVALQNVGLQAWVQQGGTRRAAGGVLIRCGTTLGVLPPGSCINSFPIGADDQTAYGSGTFVPGPALAIFELEQGTTILATYQVPVMLVLTPPNQPPVLQAIGNKIVVASQSLTFTVSATDPDAGNTLTFSASPLPSGAVFNTATGAFSWTPTTTQIGTQQVTFTVQDQGGLNDAETITITVSPATGPNLLPNGNFEAGRTYWTGWSPHRRLTSTTVYEGRLAAVIDFTGGPMTKELAHRRISVTGGKGYTLAAALKTVAAAGGVTAAVEVDWFASNGRLMGSSRFGETQGTTGWVQRSSGPLAAPAGAASVRIRIHATGHGGSLAYVDDVRLEALP